MQCPKCESGRLVERPAKNNVLVDHCGGCGGVWLDGGEIFFFSRRPKQLEKRLDEGRACAHNTEHSCPRCSATMATINFLGSDVEVEECVECHGMWFDKGEFQKAMAIDKREVALGWDAGFDPDAPSPSDPSTHGDAATAESDPRAHQRLAAVRAGLLPLPNLFLRSISCMFLLYALLGAVLVAVVEFDYVPAGGAVAIMGAIVVFQFLLGPWILDLTLRWMYAFSWQTPKQLPGHLRKFIERVTQENGMPFPRVGLIHDGAPNAFTYGHTPRNMRIVISQGVLDLLEPEESEAVVAHEIGHGKHWDMLLMTVAQLVPLILYYIYRLTISSGNKKNNNKGGPALAVGIGAYVLYIVSQYVVLWLSRVREFHADRFAGKATANPNALAAALVKIAYGLAARSDSPNEDEKPSKKKGKGKDKGKEESKGAAKMDALGALGIFDSNAARSLVLTATEETDQDAAKTPSSENLKSAMQWDLWNPWARWYELHSTHPLVAHRLQYLADQAASMDQEPYVVFDRRQPESYWDEFAVDLSVLLSPVVAPIAVALCWTTGVLDGIGSSADSPVLAAFAILVGGLGVTGLLRTLYSYRGGFFAPMTVAGLLHRVKVSRIRPVPARVKGRIIGRGVPGLIWSEDFVMQDRTGILFLDYRQPLRIWEWLFGLVRAGSLAGEDFEATGWYRRGPVPYFELRTLTVGRRTRRCYVYHAKLVTACAAVLAGIVLFGFSTT